MRGRWAKGARRDPRACQESANQERMVSQGSRGSQEGKGNQALLAYRGVQACPVTVNQGFRDLRVTRDMPVSQDLQV